MKNKLPAAAAVRTPRGMVKVNGAELTGWLSLDFEENEFQQPDTFSVQVAVSGLPKAMDLKWWASTEKAEIEIYVGFPADPLQFGADELDLMFTGVVDDLDVDWDDLTMDLRGRDRTSLLADHKTSEQYRNNTASEVATKLAGKYGLTPVVTATTTKVGKFYQVDTVDIKSSRTEWDLLTWLAQQEGFVAFVRGKELHFQPRDRGGQDPYVFEYVPATDEQVAQGNFVNLATGRVLTVAKEIEVTVTSWDAKKKAAYKKVAKRAGRGEGETQRYTFNMPGLTPEQAQEQANKRLDEISRHAMRLAVDGPADNLLRIDDRVELRGTATAFDQSYYPESIMRRLVQDGGYDWSLTAKNKIEEAQSDA